MSNELPDIQPPSGGYQPPSNWGGGYNKSPFSSSGGGDASKDMLAYIAIGFAAFSLCAWIIPFCGCLVPIIAIGLGYLGLPSNQSTLAKVAIGTGVFTLLVSFCITSLTVLSSLSG